MKCPHCDKEIPGSPCTKCGEIIPEGAKYCMECGLSLGQDIEDEDIIEDQDIIEDGNGFDMEDRVLCPDGTCTGIIVDGKCVECGKVPGKKNKKSKN